VPDFGSPVGTFYYNATSGSPFCLALELQGKSQKSALGPLSFLVPSDYQFNGGPNFTLTGTENGYQNYTAKAPYEGVAKLTFILQSNEVGDEVLTLDDKGSWVVKFNIDIASQIGPNG